MTCWPRRLLRKTFDSPGVNRVRHEPDDVESQLRERAAHLVETVLGLDDDLVEAVVHRPALPALR